MAKVFTRSYSGGVVTPEFFGRVDDNKYQTGLAVCDNWVVTPHGPVQNRGGSTLVREVKNTNKITVLRKFVFAQDQALVIEIGEGYFRFHAAGATLLASGAPYEVENPYLEADLEAIQFVQSNDVLTLTHEKYPPAELKRTSATVWSYSTIPFASPLSPPTGISATATPITVSPGTPTLQSYTVTAVSGQSESAEGSSAFGSAAITSISNANPGVFVTGYATDLVVNAKVFVSGVGGMAALNDKYYLINSVTVVPPIPATPGAYNGPGEPPDPGEPGVPGYCTITLKDESTGTPLDTTAFATYTGGGTLAKLGAARCSNNLFDTGAYNTISWSAVTGAQRYNVYKLTNGLYGFIGQTESLSFTDDNIAGDISKTPPIQEDPFAGIGNYPSAIGYFEQRRCFAGTLNKPANFWATRSGTESNLAFSIPQRDDDRIAFKIAARERNSIRHIVPMANLVLLTEAGEWRILPASGEALTPDVSIRAQSYIGSAIAQPVIVNNNLIFVAARGGHARELAYNFDAQGYVTGDLSLRAPHLFDGFTIRQVDYSKAPIPIVWFVSSSGTLLGFTYVPEQQVGSWFTWTTKDGAFESVAVVPEGEVDVLYAVVRRTINGVTRRFVERFETRRSVNPETQMYLDCGARYSGAPVTTISGLEWLTGATVSILADGAVLPDQTVVAGTVTLEYPASQVDVGLTVTSDLQTLPLAVEVEAYAQARPKNVNMVTFKVFKTRDIKVGPTFDKLTTAKPRSTEPMGSPPDLRTGEVDVAISASWNDSAQICLRHSTPTPATILGHTLDFVVGG